MSWDIRLMSVLLSFVLAAVATLVVTDAIGIAAESDRIDEMISPDVFSLTEPDGRPIGEEDLETVRAMPGVADAAGQYPLEILLLQTSPYRFHIAPVTAGYLSIRGLRLRVGREAISDDECVLGFETARELLGRDSTDDDAIGAVVSVGASLQYRVVGILDAVPDYRRIDTIYDYYLFSTVPPDGRRSSELDMIWFRADDVEAARSAIDQSPALRALALRDHRSYFFFGWRLRSVIYFAVYAMVAVLCIVYAANYVALSLVSVERRHREVLIRRALGATRGRIAIATGLATAPWTIVGCSIAYTAVSLASATTPPVVASAVATGIPLVLSFGVGLLVSWVTARQVATATSFARSHSGRHMGHMGTAAGVALSICTALAISSIVLVESVARGTVVPMRKYLDEYSSVFVVDPESAALPALLPPPPLAVADAGALARDVLNLDSASAFVARRRRLVPAQVDVVVVASEAGFLRVNGVPVEGRDLTEQDVAAGSSVAVVGAGLAESLGLDVDQTIELWPDGEFSIVGRIRETTNTDVDTRVVVPITAIEEPTSLTHVSLMVRGRGDETAVAELEDDVRSYFGSKYAGYASVAITNRARSLRSDVYSTLVRWEDRIRQTAMSVFFLGLVGSLLLSTMQVMNDTYYLSIMRCFGARRWQVFAHIAVGQCARQLVGSAAAVALLFLVGSTTQFWVPAVQSVLSFRVSIDFTTGILVLGTLTATTLSVSAIPSLRAALVDPAVALRRFE